MRIRAVAGWAFLATLCMFAGACNKNAVDPNLPAITTQPVDVTAAAGSTATFTVVATGQGTLTYQWFVFAKAIKGATSPTYTTGTLAPSDNNSFYFVLVTNSIGSTESNEVLLTVTTGTTHTAAANTLGNANPSDVLTQHNDAARTGQYLGETVLTPTNVNSTSFGKLGNLMTDGAIDAQPLYASGVTLPSGDVRNVLYAASEHGSVYSFDATSGAVIWQKGLLGANEQPSDSGTCSSAPQERAITATPLIDRTRGPHGAVYVIANTKDSAGTSIQRIHALDIATGAELFSGPTLIQASASAANVANSSAQQNFDAGQYQPLSGLQLVNGKVYAVFGPGCSAAADSGWVMGFDAASLSPSGSLYFAPGGPDSSRYSLAELAADSSGDIFAFGQQDRTSAAPNAARSTTTVIIGSTYLRLSTAGQLALTHASLTTGFSSMSMNSVTSSASGRAIVLPDVTDVSGKVSHLALGTGSDGSVYLLDRDSATGKVEGSSSVLQNVRTGGSPSGISDGLAYFSNVVFHAVSGQPIKSFKLTDSMLSTTPESQSSTALSSTGAQISISANGENGGVLWVVEDGTGVLHAYNATNLSQELYNSTQAANSRDAFASTVSSVPPTIAGGRVYIATKNGIVVFGQMK